MSKVLAAAGIAAICSMACSIPGAAQSTSAWPQFGNTNGHSFYSADPSLTTSTASQLGVKWMANLFSTDLGSPVVAYNAVLQKTVVYVGNERADVFAIDAEGGQILWSTNVGLNDKLRATPVVAPDGSVWVGTNFNSTLYKLDGATGAVDCSVKSLDGLAIMGSPMAATPPGGSSMIYWDSIDGTPVTVNGPIVGTHASDCTTAFSFTNYRQPHGGPWTTPAYAVSASGEPLVIAGTADTDSTEYAIDANTGARVWYYAAYNPADYDIGDAATVSPPGNNGFAHGAVYFNSKYGIEYAVDLSTGQNLWQFNIYPSGWGGLRNTISSAALAENQIVFGYANGVYSLNATTGSPVWQYNDPAEVASSPAIAGPTGSEVVAFGDYTGAFRVLGLSSGSQIYKYQTSGYITASPAIANGTIYIASSDGFLYAYAPGGGNTAAPSSAIASPSNNSQIANPNGSVTVTGSSSDGSSVAGVEIAVQSNGTSGSWYNGVAGTWSSAPYRNHAVLSNAGSASTTWSYAFPVPATGGTYKIFANTVGGSHIVDRGASISLTVLPSKSEPTLKTSVAYVSPGSTFTSSGNAFKPGETVTFTLLGKSVATATVGATGNIPQTTILVPSDGTFGPTSLVATGGTSGKATSATITVTNEWTQFGYNAARTAGEPNDSAIATTIDVGKGTILGQSWVYPTGAAVNTSPAIVNGAAYIANDAGVVTAVNTQTGAARWKYKTPSGAPIRSSVAIDPAGQAIFGSNDGNIYFVGPTGALNKSVALGGNLGAPAVANSNIIIASDNGTVYSISDPSGTIKWKTDIGASIHSPVSYDAMAGVVIVGDDSGAITALNSGTGAQRWKIATGGPVTAAASIYNNNVYIGSADSNFYAIKESSGALEWKFLADSAIQAGATVGGASNITFGTKNGTIYQVSPTGAQKFKQAGRYGNTPIVGVSGVDQNAFGTTAGGLIGATREAGTSALNPWSLQLGAAFGAPPAILNGTVYAGSGDGNLYAFTPNGATPMSVVRAGSALIKITSGWTCTTQP